MIHKKLCVVFVAILLTYDIVEGKKSKKIKRLKPEEEDAAPQPDVVSYSTFGFNDVGTYEGFVPTSPDYARLLSGTQESPTKQESDGYSTSVGSTGYSNSFGSSQPFNSQSFTVSDDGPSQPTLMKYPPTAAGTFSESTLNSNNNPYKNMALDDTYPSNNEGFSAPVYGTKLSSKGRGKPFYQLNSTEFNEVKISPGGDKTYFGFQESKLPFDNKPTQNVELSNSFQQFPVSSTSPDDYGNVALPDNQNSLKFPRVVDFTRFKSYYPELDTSQMPATPKPDVFGTSNDHIDVFSANTAQADQSQLFQTATSYKDPFDQKRNEYSPEKNILKFNSFISKDNSYNIDGDDIKGNHGIKSNSEHKKKLLKDKPWQSGNFDHNKWKDHFSNGKGYEYVTDYSNTSFKYDSDEPKKSFNNNFDEIVPAESNLDIPSYRFPDTDFSTFKKMPSYKVHEEDEYDKLPSFKDTFKKTKPDYNKYKASTSSSYWGNVFPSSELSSYNNHQIKTLFENEEVVNIPKRPSKWNYEKTKDKPSELSLFGRRPSKSRPWKDWTKPSPTRYKSEEDLLDIRNQDTSHPSYLPTHHSNYVSDENDYKKLVDKWRQSYLKSKYRESLRDYESYSETKPMHVALPKPYPIEVPHPVIVPVPQPYPVRVPVPKPVAVPVIQELKIPIEKPVPYPVIKNVPFPIEKPVPVPVEKEVPVPVVKPYPVHIPYVRPVFHHTKSRDEEFRHDDDYFPRHEESHKLTYRKKKPQSSRDRLRRPSRTVYHQERNRRRWPERRRPTSFTEPSRRPSLTHSTNKHRDFEPEGLTNENEYYLYCRKTGNC